VIAGNGVLPNLLEIIAILAAAAGAWLIVEGYPGWAFLATATTIATAARGAAIPGLDLSRLPRGHRAVIRPG
jgi:hypothetical protein